MMLLLSDWLVSVDAGFSAIQYITLSSLFVMMVRSHIFPRLAHQQWVGP